ncbi:hypothetical protein HX021_08135 [Sphingobacterium sp. N143]|uniref:hypothetical protein n=1 Tax=Sphingobacterium sp. N143 TaxID=2746727 RepID=UPI002574E886|nr:hypothetical protein [Sphingobacterium sp. N143]MDM1294266.1 hypothetical protein [Sphingobacterium sp. N143]
MKQVLVLLLVITTLFSCSKDDKLSGVDLSGSWVESGSTVTPPVIWKFDNGVLMMNTTKKGDYDVVGKNRIDIKSTDGNVYKYETSLDNDILNLTGISNNFTLSSSMKSKYSFKRYVDK